MADALVLQPKQTALVLIDLQKGILGRQTAPHSARDVLARSASLAEQFRRAGGLVVLVHVSFSADGGDRLTQPVDETPPSAAPPPGYDEISPDLG
ncbi:MAG TPA: isochorismatase family protein, partial [Gemmatimonadaceae bacterium]|nr:isochorismatase family protein [Gemmatimonadaceae bacterium]